MRLSIWVLKCTELQKKRPTSTVVNSIDLRSKRDLNVNILIAAKYQTPSSYQKSINFYQQPTTGLEIFCVNFLTVYEFISIII